jgi:DNA-binding IclR family transcriptional regulator
MSAVTAVGKAFSMLEFLVATERSATLAEATQMTRLPKPTAHRLLRALQKLGYVSRPPGTRSYSMGPRLARLQAGDSHAHVKALARPAMAKLHQRFNETVNLGMLSGREVLYLEYQATSHALRIVLRPGDKDPYYCTALGRAMVSALPLEECERIIEATHPKRQTPKTLLAKSSLRSLLGAVRKNGFAEEHGESVDGISCLAVHLGQWGYPQYAISLAVPTPRLKGKIRTQMVQALKILATGDAASSGFCKLS